ncbi:MAG: GNAT family N-acetyltransferase [Arenimonas sp.]
MTQTNTPQWAKTGLLKGRSVSLEPLAIDHVAGLQEATRDGELWQLWFASVPTPETTQHYVEQALSLREQGKAMPFVVRDAEGIVVGSTRYGNIDADNKRLEIGWTWYAQRAQRTALNTEAKLLLLSNAFENLGAIAVEFRTNWFNHRSRTAIARLGAKQDGVLRNHMLMPDGTRRDTVVFSILDTEWPAVKKNLQHQLQRYKAEP